MRAAEMFEVVHASALLERVLYDEASYRRFLSSIAVSVTEFFCDPEFFACARETLLPVLATYPRLRIWHAGCATGQEVYSMAIMLKEASLLQRAQFYATDIDLEALSTARDGVYPMAQLTEAEAAYERAGGRASFRNYFVPRSDDAGTARVGIMHRELRDRITWSPHDLGRDEAVTEANLIVCRNTLIYFNRALQDRVIDLFRRSLVPRGFLALGDKETLDFSAHGKSFELLLAAQRIYRASVVDHTEGRSHP
jgi:chemotaxis protein methyltransferase CheR